MRLSVFTAGLSLLILGGLALISYSVARWTKGRLVLAAEKRPYTIWLRDFTYVNQRNGNLDFHTPRDSVVYLQARKSDGSTVHVTFARFASERDFSVGLRKVISVPDRAMWVVHGASGTKTTFPLREGELIEHKGSPLDPTCVSHPERLGGSEFLGYGSHLDVPVVKHRVKSSTAVIEVWEAPDFDCLPVYQKVLFLDGHGGVSGATIRSAFSISFREPEPWLFEAGSARESPPSEALEAEMRALGAGGGQSGAAQMGRAEKLRRLDAAYLERRGAVLLTPPGRTTAARRAHPGGAP